MYIMDPTSCIRFSSVFPKKARTILCKTDPDLIWMAWSGFGPTHHQESLGPILGRTQQACYQFPIFRLGCVLPPTAQIMLCKTRLDQIWFWLTVSLSSFGQIDPVWHKNHLACFWPIQIGCEMDPACLLGQFAALKSSLKSHLFKLFH